MGYVMPTAPGEYDPVREILEQACTSTFHVMSDTKKAAEIRDARESTFVSGLAFALAAVLNDRRLEFFEALAMEEDNLPALMQSDVVRPLRELRNKWRGRDREVKWPDFWATDCQSFIMNLLASDDIMELETARHRRAVLAGKEEPRASDHKWLEEEAARQATEAATLREAAEEADRAARLLADARVKVGDLKAPAEVVTLYDEQDAVDTLVEFIKENQPLVDDGSETAKREVARAEEDLAKLGYFRDGSPIVKEDE